MEDCIDGYLKSKAVELANMLGENLKKAGVMDIEVVGDKFYS